MTMLTATERAVLDEMRKREGRPPLSDDDEAAHLAAKQPGPLPGRRHDEVEAERARAALRDEERERTRRR